MNHASSQQLLWSSCWDTGYGNTAPSPATACAVAGDGAADKGTGLQMNSAITLFICSPISNNALSSPVQCSSVEQRVPNTS